MLSQNISQADTKTAEAVRNFDTLPACAYVRPAVVRALCSCSKATLERMVKDGRLPTPRKLSARAIGFNVGELRRALAA